MFRKIHGFLKLLYITIIVAMGVLLYFYSTGELWQFYAENETIQALSQRADHDLYRQILGGVFAGLAVVAILPRWRRRKKGREMSFSGAHGDVTIALEPVEATLERVAGKLPEVRSISIRLKPLEAQGSVRVIATAVLRKEADSDIRLLTARVNSYIKTHTMKILGANDVDVKLKLKKLEMIMKTVRPEPLMLEAPTPEYASGPVVDAPSSSRRRAFEPVDAASNIHEMDEVDEVDDVDEIELETDEEERASGSW